MGTPLVPAIRPGTALALGLASVIALAPAPASAQTRAPSDVAASRPAPYRPAPRYQDAVRYSRYLTMRDGVRIAIDWYLPRDLAPGARLPTILRQTRYWRSLDLTAPPPSPLDAFSGALGRLTAVRQQFVLQGYAWVDVDVRGSGASFGTRPQELGPDEIRDGAEIVDWIVAQPWSNGAVGATGISYDGSTAELLLLNRHPAVKAVAPLFALYDAYADITFPGGVPLRWFIESWSAVNQLLDRNQAPPQLGTIATGVRPVDDDRDRALLAAAIRDHAANADLARDLAPIAFRDDPPASGRFPSLDAMSPRSHAGAIAASGAAVYGVSGWFDGAYPRAAVRRFLASANPADRLLIGPWGHAGEQNVSPTSAGPAGFDLGGELLKFFDHHLRGVATGIAAEPRVHYFTMGEDRWKAADSWPPRATPTPYYFGPDSSLVSRRPTAPAAADEWRIDPAAGTGDRTRWKSLLGASLVPAYPDRAERDRALHHYTSAPLARGLEVSGHPVAHLHLSSPAPDGAFFVYLEDVDPAGGVTYVTEGALRAVHRRLLPGADTANGIGPLHSFVRADALPLEPGRVVALTIELLPTSYLFRAGHRIRVALSGADRDHFAAVPGAPSAVRLHRDRARPSGITLPVAARP